MERGQKYEWELGWERAGRLQEAHQARARAHHRNNPNQHKRVIRDNYSEYGERETPRRARTWAGKRQTLMGESEVRIGMYKHYRIGGQPSASHIGQASIKQAVHNGHKVHTSIEQFRLAASMRAFIVPA
jgi:hypothetical protein